ncbi:MAG: sugar ABC transporter permease, partial [Streptomyces sp.]|nr:sugar ABC transporter permease [Streptomyces sp.]
MAHTVVRAKKPAPVSGAPKRPGRLPRAAVHHPWWFALPAIVVFAGFFLVPNL